MRVLILFVLTFKMQSIFAWGPTGHRVVGEIADNYLKLGTKLKIKKILDGHSLARVSNWPDKIKSDPDTYAHTFRWHYTDWPDGSDQYDPVNNNGSLVVSIKEMLDKIKNKKLKKEDRAFAIKFLVHLVGDLHQPLHVGNGLDRGGNNCKVVFHDEVTNLHRLWDSNLIDFTKLSYKELARFVNVTDKRSIQDYRNGNVLSWAKESKDLRSSLYPEEPVPLSKKKNTEQPSYCLLMDQDIPEDQLPQLGYKYSYKFMPILENRLLKAGIRLAKLLDDAL